MFILKFSILALRGVGESRVLLRDDCLLCSATAPPANNLAQYRKLRVPYGVGVNEAAGQ